MLDLVQMYYHKGALQECLSASQNAITQTISEADRLKCLEFAALSALKLGMVESLAYCQIVFEQHSNQTDSTFWALTLTQALMLNSKHQEAAQILEPLTNRNNPLKLEVLRLLLDAYKAQNLPEKADSIYRILLQNNPTNWNLWNEFITMYCDAGAYENALAICQNAYTLATQALQQTPPTIPQLLNPNSLDARVGRIAPNMIENPAIAQLKAVVNQLALKAAAIHLENFKNPKAEAQEALKILASLQEQNMQNPNFWYQFAKTLEYTEHYAESEMAYKKIFGIPNATQKNKESVAFQLAYLLMRQDRFSEALELYESRLVFGSLETVAYQHYLVAKAAFKQDSNVFTNKVIAVNCEQGFGDALMYGRCLSALCKVAKKVLFLPHTPMYPLFKTHFVKKGFENLEVLNTIPQNYDFLIPLTSIPYFLQLDSLEKITALPSPIAPFKTSNKKRKKKRIGFFWHTNFALKENNTRNFSLEFFLNFLLDLKNVELVSLQVGEFALPKNIENAGAHFKDWLETYDIVKTLDCVVGIDSSPAHLSAICGVPTLVILQPRFDWRFGLYSAPKAKFYGEHLHTFVANPNDLSTKDSIQAQLQAILES